MRVVQLTRAESKSDKRQTRVTCTRRITTRKLKHGRTGESQTGLPLHVNGASVDTQVMLDESQVNVCALPV